MGNYTVAGLRNYYLAKWNNMVITRGAAVDAAARHVIAGMARYKDLEKTTGVPWKFIGIVHLRESDCNFHTHLHNGDPLTARTRHVPAGRPLRGSAPFTFEYSAVDALTMMGYTSIKEWTIEQVAFCFEAYNGWGYRMHGIPSAYLWSGTNQYSSGKYVSDGVFDPGAVDVQLGTMAVLKRVMEFTGEPLIGEATTIVSVQAPVAVPVNTPPHLPNAIPGGKAEPPKISNKDLKATSRKYFWTDIVGTGAKLGATSLALFKAIDVAAIQATKEYVDALKQFAHDDGLYIALLALIAFGLYTAVLKDWMKQDVQEGRATPSGDVSVGASAPQAEVVAEAPNSTPQPPSGLLAGIVLPQEEPI